MRGLKPPPPSGLSFFAGFESVPFQEIDYFKGFPQVHLRILRVSRMNKEWHAKNEMPRKATLEQRIRWHKEHQKHCACRNVPKSLAPYFKEA